MYPFGRSILFQPGKIENQFQIGMKSLQISTRPVSHPGPRAEHSAIDLNRSNGFTGHSNSDKNLPLVHEIQKSPYHRQVSKDMDDLQ